MTRCARRTTLSAATATRLHPVAMTKPEVTWTAPEVTVVAPSRIGRVNYNCPGWRPGGTNRSVMPPGTRHTRQGYNVRALSIVAQKHVSRGTCVTPVVSPPRGCIEQHEAELRPHPSGVVAPRVECVRASVCVRVLVSVSVCARGVFVCVCTCVCVHVCACVFAIQQVFPLRFRRCGRSAWTS